MTPGVPARDVTLGDLAAVAAGGALGTLLRATGHLLRPQAIGEFPWTTLGENLLGAFVLGWLAAWLLSRPEGTPAASHHLHPFLTTGLLGSFTTFSALAVEGVELLAVAPGIGFIYLAASVLLGPLLALAGLRLGEASAPSDMGGPG